MYFFKLFLRHVNLKLQRKRIQPGALILSTDRHVLLLQLTSAAEEAEKVRVGEITTSRAGCCLPSAITNACIL